MMDRLRRWWHAHRMALSNGFHLRSFPISFVNVREGGLLLTRFRIYAGVDLGGRKIYVYHDKVGSPVWYAAALHEIGHTHRLAESYLYANAYTCSVDAAYLKEEQLAWKWARQNAIYWDDEMDALRNLAMECYYEEYIDTVAERLLGSLQWPSVESGAQRG